MLRSNAFIVLFIASVLGCGPQPVEEPHDAPHERYGGVKIYPPGYDSTRPRATASVRILEPSPGALLHVGAKADLKIHVGLLEGKLPTLIDAEFRQGESRSHATDRFSVISTGPDGVIMHSRFRVARHRGRFDLRVYAVDIIRQDENDTDISDDRYELVGESRIPVEIR